MIIWDKSTRTLKLEGRYEQGTFNENVEKQLASAMITAREGAELKESSALAYGAALFKKILDQTAFWFKPRLGTRYLAAISPSWTFRSNWSRFTGKEHRVAERHLLRIRLKLKPGFTVNSMKMFIQLRERLKDPLETPVDHELLPLTTCKVKFTLVEKFQAINTEIDPPMKQYLLAKSIKSQLDQLSTSYPLQLKVTVDQRKEKDRLIIIGELSGVEKKELMEFIGDMLKQLGKYGLAI